MKSRSSFASFLRRSAPALLLAAGLFVLFYFAAYRLTFVESDYGQHGRWAMIMSKQAMLETFYNGSERLWHIFVRLTFDHLIHDLYKSCAAVTAFVDAVAYLLVFWTFDQVLPKKTPRWLAAAVLLVPFAASALTLPGGSLYVGVGGLNTWHNPTNVMVRPFAAAVFYMTVRIYNRRRSGEHAVFAAEAGDFVFEGGFWAQFRKPVFTPAELILYPVCLLLSVYSKPSFLQFFAPAIFLFLLADVIRTHGMLLPFCIKLAIAYIPAVIILFMALREFFPSGAAAAEASAVPAAGGSGIAIYFIQPSFSGAGDFFGAVLEQLKYLVLPCAFPLLIAVLCVKRPDVRPMMRLAAVGLAVAFAETLMLHETGYRADHGNFLWGMYLASWLLWTAAAGAFLPLAAERSKTGRIALYAGTALLVWHLVCGVVYLVLILRTGVYYL